jgi:hypothetical protein
MELRNWAMRNNFHARFAGVVVGALAMAAVLGLHDKHGEQVAVGDRVRGVSEPVFMPAPRVPTQERAPPEVVVATAPAAANYNGPVASRPMVTAPSLIGKVPLELQKGSARAAAQDPPVPVVAASASPPVTLAAMPRRNVGCGLWPIGSDADRACAARQWGREDLTLRGWRR